VPIQKRRENEGGLREYEAVHVHSMYILCMRLSPDDRAFFTLLAGAVFANPFSEAREKIDAKVAGVRGVKDADLVIARMLGVLAERLAALDGGRDLARWDAADRELLELAVLFEVFHRYAPALDALVDAELASPGKPARVPFARDVLRTLARHGIAEDAACQYLAFFWQLRRAFHFIGRALPGRAPSMRRLRESLWDNVFTSDPRLYARALWRKMEDFSTFLVGETGTGKTAAAAAIGRSGHVPFDPQKSAFAVSFTSTFLAVNLSQFPEALLESELFGHRKGAFTGAIDAHLGVFQRCSAHGAIFLDEIGEAPPSAQVKLLRVLQERVFSPVGSHETHRFEGRVIVATNRPVAEARAAGTFRDDFYYRLSSDVVRVPSLRDRLREDPGEIDVLLETIVKRTIGERDASIEARVKEAIVTSLGPKYAWPGNVRELEQCVRRVILTGRCAPDDRGSRDPGDQRLLDATGGGTEPAERLLARYCRALFERFGTYEEVARRAKLDRRTAKRYATM
jgi:DNA-binding NtrC family response regulator